MPTDLLDDVINAAPAAAPKTSRSSLDEMLDDVPEAPKQASGDLSKPAPMGVVDRLRDSFTREIATPVSNIVKGSVHNIGDLMAATGPMLSPEMGGTSNTPPSPEQVQALTKATEESPLPITKALPPPSPNEGPAESAVRGVAGGLEGATSFQNLGIMAGTSGSAAIANALTGYPAVAAKALNAGLGAYFAEQMATGAGQNVADAYHAYQKGDMQGVAQHLGAGTVDGLFTLFGLKHLKASGADILRTRVPNWKISPLPDEPTEPPPPEGLNAATGEIAPPAAPGASPVEPEANTPPGTPGKPAKPPKPASVEKVSPATPNPPTAAVPTAPEAPETIALQLQQLGEGHRKAVMFPKGTPAPTVYPPGTAVTSDAFGNTYVFRPDLTNRSAIKRAAKNNTLPEILGSAEMGMGAPDKSALQGEPVTVVGRAPDGTEAQSTGTDQANLPVTLAATQHVTPPGGSVSVEPAENVIAERQQQPAPPVPPQSQTGLDQMGGDIADAITGNMYGMLWDKAQAGDVTEGGRPSALLQAAKLVRDRGGLQSPEEFKSFAQEYAQIPRDANFQQAMRDLVGGHAPAAPAPDDLASVVDAAPAAPRKDLAAPQSLEPAKTAVAAEPRPLVDVRTGTHQELFGHAIDEGSLKEARKAYKPVLDLQGNPTGWLQHPGMPMLLHPTEDRLVNFVPADLKSGSDRQRAYAMAHAFAIDHPVTAPTKTPKPVTPQVPSEEGTKYVLPSFVTAPHRTSKPAPTVSKANLIPVRAEDGGVRWVAQPIEETPQTDLAAPKGIEPAAEEAPTKHEFASTQANLSGPVAKAMVEYGKRIPDGKLTEDGRETESHVTVKYGLHGNDPEAVAKVLENEPPITATLGKTSLFSNDKADVLKMDVDSPDLHRLNKLISDALPHTDTHPDYTPHATIAYLKPGEGEAYSGKSLPGVTGQKVPIDRITFSGKNGEKVEIPLKGKPAAVDLAAPQSLEPAVPSEPAKPATIQANAERPGRATEDRSGIEPARTPDSEALAAVSPEVHPEPQAKEPTVSDRGTGGDRPLGDLQRSEEQGPGGGSGGGSGAGGVDTTGERSPREPSERVGSGDLTRESTGRDFRITNDVGVGQGTPREKLNANLEAVRLVKQIEKDGRLATPDEQRKLARYTGWGGLWQIFDYSKREYAGAREELQSLLTPEEYKAAEASTKNAHYTSPDVVRAMWKAMERFGVRPGFSEIEPAMGVGNFFGLQPDSLLPARRTGVELDKITGAIAKALYPDSNIQVTGFEKISLPNDFFDVAISNVPFGNFGVYDPKYKKNAVATESIHNYFFVKGLDLVRPGGIVGFITSRYTMDSQSKALRKLLASKADLVGMIRLPDTAFKANAGTEVVTDAIFLRKRAEGEEPSGAAFIETREVPTSDGGKTLVNEYYAEHPEMMLGKLSLEGSMYAGGQQTLKGDLTPEKLQEAIEKLPQGIYKEWKPETPAFESSGYVELGDPVKDGGFDVKNGVVVVRDGNIYRPAQVGKTQEARIKGMIPVRDAVRAVYETQIVQAPEAKIVAARKKLGSTYDAFVKKFGPVNAAANRRAFGDDPDYPTIAAIEDDYDKETDTAKKTAIFTQRTIERPKTPEKADKASEALAIVLNERGRLDWDRMQQLTGKTPAEMREELGGIVFQNPDGQRWETSDEYLSGNVRQKLDLAREAANADPKFERNVEALEKIQPRDLSPEEIKVTLGAPWVPPEFVADFLRKTLDLDGAEVHYSPSVAAWSVTVPKWAAQRAANTTTYGTPDYYAHELVDLALNGKGPKVYTGPSDARVVDPKATAAAQAAQDALKERFKEWIWEQPYASKLAEKYNREMNNLRLVEHDGSHLTLPGSNPAIQLRPHQKNVIWRALKTGNTLLAHEVGAGKTWEMVGIAMESRRLGLAKKPLIVVPNHMAEQVSIEFAQLYPAARVLTIGKEDFAGDRRKKAIARIASGSWDAVIIRHSSFEKIPVSDATYQAFIDSQVDELRAALDEQRKEVGKGADKDKTVKEIQKAIARLEVKLQKRLAREKKDDAASFEQLGTDLLLVDEAHAFKALPIITRRTRVAGIPTRESNRATDMYMKTQYISKLNGGQRGVIFATGTPVTNTMAELYNMQRYLQGQTLKNAGVAHFDAWANTFGEVLRGVELDVSGKGFRENERFAKFINIPELMTMYRQMADVKTAEMMKLPRPDLEGGGPKPVAAPESPDLTAFVDSLVKRSERIRGGQVDKSEDNMLKVVSEGKKAALDMRLIDPEAEDRPDSKVNKAVQNIYDIWKETKPENLTQIVFCDLSTPKSAKKAKPKAKTEEEPSAEPDNATAVPEAAGERAGFSVYDDMKAKLIAAGIPSKEIAFIHDANTDEQKQELFDAVNAGKVRVIMGSTEKMGVGTNIQKRAFALHHMDAPWRPADIKQRDGRIQRQGNLNKTVRIFQYLTEGSFDAYSWQLLENKARFIGPVLSGELTIREMEDIGMVLPSAAEFKAMASGNPIIKEKIGTDAALGRLDAQRSGFRKQQAGIRQQLASLPGMIEGSRRVVSEMSADVKTVEENKDAGYAIGNRTFAGEDARKQAAEALGQSLDSWRGPGNPQKIGTYKGLELWTKPGAMLDSYPGITIRGSHSYAANTNPENAAATLASIESVVRNIPDRLPSWKKTLDENLKKQSELKEQEGKAWPQEAKYQELVKRKAEIDAQLAESEAEKAASIEEKPEGGSVTLGSGLGALQPAYEVAQKAAAQFLREEVVPKVASILAGARTTVDSLVHLVDPRRGVPTKTLDEIYKMKGGRDAAQYLLTRKLDKWGKRVDGMSRDEMVNFIDRMKVGVKQADPELQQLSDFLRQADDALYNEIKKHRPSLEYLENHFRVLWKVIPGSPEAKGGFKGVFRRPLQGGKGFLKQSKLADMSEGLELGGVPHTFNPIKMFTAHYADAMKFVTAQRLWDRFGDMGVRKFARTAKDAPDGYVKLDDRIANVYFPVKEGMVHAGDWYVEEGAARLLNNFLSRDLIREQPFGRALMSIKNASTAVELSISPFHAVFEGNEAVGSQIGIGLRQMWNLGVRQGNVKAVGQGLRSIATAPAAAVTAAQLGGKAKEAFGNFDEFSKTPSGQAWLKDNPTARQDVEDFFNGGGKIGMHEDYKVAAFNTFKEYAKSAGADDPGHYISAAIRSLPALNQAIMSPLFEHYIPNLKLGFFLKEYNLAKAEYSDRLATGEMTSTQLARQVVDSVENRFGEMNFDNLFWKRTFKTAAQLLFRSITWKLGNLRANVGAISGQWREIQRAIRNKEIPMLHPNMGWLLGMTFWTAVFGGTIYALATGKRPKQVKDFIYPVIDAATGIRVSLPTYWRDIMHLAHSPLGYVTSSLSGEIGRLAEVWQNKDFYGNEVWNADDSLPAKAWEILKHLVPLPFSVSSATQSKDQGGSTVARAAGYLGFTKAPHYIEQTKAEQLASEYAAQHRETGARTAQAAEQAQAISGIRSIYRRGGNAQQQVKDAIAKGFIKNTDVPKLRLQARKPALDRMVGRLSPTEALNVYDAATPEERKGIKVDVRKKLINARTKPWEWTPGGRTLAQKYFGIRPVMRRAAPLSDFAAPSALQ
jgi:N12 class adenine-specific DNA methylase